jgi:hypothetical protein
VSITLVLSVDGLTVSAAWIAGLAIVGLVLTGWRKPARAEPKRPRGGGPAGAGRGAGGVPLEHVDGEPYRRPGPIRRLLAAMASGGLALVTGALVAIILSFVAAYAVVTLTGLLKG